MIRVAAISLCAMLAPLPAIAAGKTTSPQRAVAGAGWSPVAALGNGGEQVFRRYCWECHGEGRDRPGTHALQVKYKGNPPARLDQRTDLNPEFIVYTVRHGISVMPSMRKTEIGDAELNAIADYLSRRKDETGGQR